MSTRSGWQLGFLSMYRSHTIKQTHQKKKMFYGWHVGLVYSILCVSWDQIFKIMRRVLLLIYIDSQINKLTIRMHFDQFNAVFKRKMVFLYHPPHFILASPTGRGSSIGSEFAWHASGPEFDTHVRHILSWRLGHEKFLRPFSLFRWSKKSSCQLLVKECALSTNVH